MMKLYRVLISVTFKIFRTNNGNITFKVVGIIEITQNWWDSRGPAIL